MIIPDELTLMFSTVMFQDIEKETDRQKVLQHLESGDYVLEPAFMKYPDGTLKLTSISIVSRHVSTRGPELKEIQRWIHFFHKPDGTPPFPKDVTET